VTLAALAPLPCLLTKIETKEEGGGGGGAAAGHGEFIPEYYLFLLPAAPQQGGGGAAASSSSSASVCLARVQLDAPCCTFVKATAAAPAKESLSGYLRYATYLPASGELLIMSDSVNDDTTKRYGVDNIAQVNGKVGLHPLHTLCEPISEEEEKDFQIRLSHRP